MFRRLTTTQQGIVVCATLSVLLVFSVWLAFQPRQQWCRWSVDWVGPSKARVGTFMKPSYGGAVKTQVYCLGPLWISHESS